MRLLELSGRPRAIGEAFGEICRAEIQAFYRARLDNAIAQAREHGGRRFDEGRVLRVAQQCLDLSEGWDPEGHQELLGIARAADLQPAQIWALNGLTDLRDLLAWGDEAVYGGGCSSFLLPAALGADGRLRCGQTWDLATDNMPFVIGLRRRPSEAPPTFCLTTVGCLSLIGANGEGLAIGTTNLRTRDVKPGVMYLSIIHKALRQRSFEAALEVIVSAPRAAAHYFYLADGRGRAAAIECTGALAHVTELGDRPQLQCNHALVEAHRALEADTPKASSLCRQGRMEALIAEAPPGSLGEAELVAALSDTRDGPGAICREDLDGISTNGAVVMTPSVPRVWACHGPPSRPDVRWLDLVESPATG